MVPRIRFVFGLFIILAQIWLYVNADAIYGAYSGMVKATMLAYFILMIPLSPVIYQQYMRIGIQDIPNFAVGFVATSIVMLVLGGLVALVTGEIEQGLTLALGFGFLHGFVKAFNEELIFRGAIPQMLGGQNVYSDAISSLAFGFFHFAVSGGDLVIMVFLSGLGYVWTLARRSIGVMGSTGSHFAYNLAALGVLDRVVGGQ